MTGYVEVRYDDGKGRVVYEPVKLNQEIRNFDCFQIVEAELVTRRDAEEAIGMMLRAGFDPQEAFVTTVAAGLVEVQLIQTFLIEDQRTFCAVNLKPEFAHWLRGR